MDLTPLEHAAIAVGVQLLVRQPALMDLHGIWLHRQIFGLKGGL